MGLFSQKKKTGCGGEIINSAAYKRNKDAVAKILGTGCAKCNALEAAAVRALEELGLDTSVDHVRDYEEIADYGVMATPAFVYNGMVISCGKLLKVSEIKELLKREA